ncbi:SCO2583/SCO2584 N-terminal domain-containing protein [Actinacidiphila epipremni]|jgi:hypothetical protein|uniref:Uncharacterized protein n=1 Tax=Actinacidiphila epipremni TaxID=2053013 RepID=A0ABX0ZE85_9ACTN|nr:hypothetical protein [Actinacidiphila epipremni]NJP42095.1 hypothetical protein [Actinacidiphila epipremni]
MPDDDEFASVVLDEEFVRSALFHEPTARERMLAVAEGPALPPGWPGRRRNARADIPETVDAADFPALDPLYAAGHPYRGSSTRWHRPVAWALAVVMGIGVVALTFAAVYRGAGAGARQPADPPPSSGSQLGRQTLPPVASTPVP